MLLLDSRTVRRQLGHNLHVPERREGRERRALSAKKGGEQHRGRVWDGTCVVFGVTHRPYAARMFLVLAAFAAPLRSWGQQSVRPGCCISCKSGQIAGAEGKFAGLVLFSPARRTSRAIPCSLQRAIAGHAPRFRANAPPPKRTHAHTPTTTRIAVIYHEAASHRSTRSRRGAASSAG